ncbi:hypothetical protein [Flavobacterium sp.]|uniref:hypothetical protein n=1 Tax=Flavobacterium sp. TaxID=239 RepID=UPI002B4B6312|nr:hypothetical protein [Flavobacterium sp.]HLF53534.1 hypothetical protein [Flavobacterium sp.]
MSTFKTNIWRNVAGIVAIIVIILCFMLFSNFANTARLKSNVKALTTENATYKNKLGTETTRNERLVMTVGELKQNVINKDEKIKVLTKGFAKVNTIVTTKTTTTIPGMTIPFEKPVPCNFVREGAIFRDWFSMGYKVDSTGITFKPTVIHGEQISITGFKRKWLLGKQTAVTEVTNINPFTKTVDVKSYETTVPKKWYDSKLLWLSAGLITGALIIN